jgi:hypothetical protein
MKTVLFITIVTFGYLSYIQPNDKTKATLAYEHQRAMAVSACPAATASKKHDNGNWIYLKSDSSNINMMLLDYHNSGQNSFGFVRKI